MNEITLIQNADWIIGWDSDRKEHVYIKNGDFVFRGQEVVFTGRNYEGKFDHKINGQGKMVSPGFINIHSHLSGGPLDKGIFDEAGAACMWGHALYSHSPLLKTDENALLPGAIVALSELLKSGVTTVVDISGDYSGWIELMAKSGIRGVLGPGFRQARWINVDDHRVDYEWDEDAGWKGFERALEIIDSASKHPSRRLSGLIIPSQADTCRPDLIKAAHNEAKKRGIPFQIHAAQTMVEFSEIIRRYGKSPVQWLDSIGVLDERTILGHCIYLDHHSWTPLRTEKDLPLLADKKVTVAHCPTVFGRTGMTLESLGKYVRTGVNVGIGTDSFPYNMLEEMRHAAIYSRITTGNVHDLTTAAVFNSATTGGARALMRDDLGKLEPGARADFIIIDTEHPQMKPGREPLWNLIYSAAERAVEDVYIDGIKVVDKGNVLTLDYLDAVKQLNEAQLKAIEKIPEFDSLNRNLDEIAPMSFRKEE